MSRTSRVNDVQLAKWLEAVLCGETDMADDMKRNHVGFKGHCGLRSDQPVTRK